MQPTIYLFFDGRCLEAMRHYADVLGGTIESVFRNADAPDEHSRMPGADDLVMNLSMRLGSTTIMASDTPADWYRAPQGFRVHIEAPSRAEFDRVLDALGQEARAVDMPAGETFWAERFAMFTDRYGTPWMLSFMGSKAEG
ncbi:MAG: VOC family protein [Salinarimonas sp.]